MKLLSISKPKASMGTLPPAVLKQLLETCYAAMRQQKEAGKIVEYYYAPTGYSIVILDYKDADEWVRDKRNLPILNYMDEEVYPLAEGFGALKAVVESIKV